MNHTDESCSALHEGIAPSVIRAAQYIRTATDAQQDSMEKQADIIREFASKNGMEVVRTYADSGKGGMTLEGRAGLQQMLKDVTSGTADYEVILMVDVSRWGRFHDADQSAYCEYICKRHKIRVEYCADTPINEKPASFVIIRAIKRAMEREYRRELSHSVKSLRGDPNVDTLLKESAEWSTRMHAAIAIGTEFISDGNKWRCTDKGTRTIVAIKLDKDDQSWYNGPPYTVAEMVFDEYALEAVALTMEEWRDMYGED